MSQEVVTQNREEEQVELNRPVGRIYRPLVDIVEREDALILLAELPGVSPENLSVTVEKRLLTIQGEIQRVEPEGYQSYYNELPQGRYQRTFNLGESVDTTAISADLQNGLLTLTLPKMAKAVPQKIAITVS